MTFRLGIRIEFARPGSLFGNEQLYNSIVTAHGLIMIFFVVIPIMIRGFGNWLIPLMLGAIDMVFPRLNNMRYWFIPAALVLIIISLYIEGGRGTG